MRDWTNLYRVFFVLAAVTGLILISAALYTGLALQETPRQTQSD